MSSPPAPALLAASCRSVIGNIRLPIFPLGLCVNLRTQFWARLAVSRRVSVGEINEMYSNHALLHGPYAHPHHVHPEISVGLCVDLQHEGAVSGEHSTSLSLSSGGLFRVFALVHLVQDSSTDDSMMMMFITITARD